MSGLLGRLAFSAGLLLLFAGLVGCNPGPRTAIVVAIGSSIEPGPELRAIRAQVRDTSDGAVHEYTFQIACDAEGLDPDGNGTVSLPLSFTILPRDEAQLDRPITLTLTAIDGSGGDRATLSRDLSFVRGSLMAARFTLDGTEFTLEEPMREVAAGEETRGLPEPICATADAGLDGGGIDGGPDAGMDAGPDGGAPSVLTLHFPWNGYATGSIHAPTTLVRHPQTPEFHWASLPGATGYTLFVATGCPTESYRSCNVRLQPGVQLFMTGGGESFIRPDRPIPVSTTAPVGDRYYWQVEAQLPGGGIARSEVRYLEVGRQRTDLDGDGYADLIVGSPSHSTGRGRVDVDFGSASWSPEVRGWPIENSSGVVGERLGAALAAGDLDADGYGDLIVGAPGFRGIGGVSIHFGERAPGTRPPITLSPPISATATSGSEFGAAVAFVGDVDGDGYGDLLVGAPLYEPSGSGEADQGAAFLFRGGPAGVRNIDSPIALYNPTRAFNDRFGAAVAGLGDVDGDGYPDFAIGAPGATEGGVEGGAVYLYYGGPGVMPEAPSETILAPSSQSGANFGAAIGGAGDLDGDLLADLVIGAPNRDLGAGPDLGSASVLFGTRGGPPGSRIGLDNPIAASDDPPGYFGTSVAGIGPDPMTRPGSIAIGGSAIAEPADPLQVGRAYRFVGSGSRTLTASAPLRATGAPNVSEVGYAIAGIGDLDGNGYPDLAVGGPSLDGTATRSGMVLVYRLDGSVSISPPTLVDSPSNFAAGRYGHAIAGACP